MSISLPTPRRKEFGYGRTQSLGSFATEFSRRDVQEFCERDPGGETVQNGGRLTVTACVDRYLRQVDRIKVVAAADCDGASLVLRNGSDIKRVHFPVDDTSCAAGTPPLIAQFIKLCPTRARQLGMTSR
jgi:hypothetical protein